MQIVNEIKDFVQDFTEENHQYYELVTSQDVE